MYAFKRDNHKLWNITHDFVHTRRIRAETWIRQKIGRGKVEPVIEASVEDCGKLFGTSGVIYIALHELYADVSANFQNVTPI